MCEVKRRVDITRVCEKTEKERARLWKNIW